MAKWNPKAVELANASKDESKPATERMLAMVEIADMAANNELILNDDGTKPPLFIPDKEPEPRYEYKFVKGARVKVRIN